MWNSINTNVVQARNISRPTSWVGWERQHNRLINFRTLYSYCDCSCTIPGNLRDKKHKFGDQLCASKSFTFGPLVTGPHLTVWNCHVSVDLIPSRGPKKSGWPATREAFCLPFLNQLCHWITTWVARPVLTNQEERFLVPFLGFAFWPSFGRGKFTSRIFKS